MRKVSSLVCTATALLLTFGTAMAEEGAPAPNEQGTAAATTSTESASPAPATQPKEVTADPAPSQDNAGKSQKEPGCD